MLSKALIVVGTEGGFKAITSALKGTFSHFIKARDCDGAARAFESEQPECVIVASDTDAIEACAAAGIIRGMKNGGHVPIIMLFANVGRPIDAKLAGFDAGASDCLVEPYETVELVLRVNAALKNFKVVRDIRDENIKLSRLAVTDELTGLYNRRYFFEVVQSQMALGTRHGFKIACLLLDIDHFKQVNDTFGHAAGDEILKKTGAILNTSRRDGELLARLGGEEFVICLFNTDSESSLLAAEKFRNLIKAHDFSSPLHPTARLTVSIGIAVYPQKHKLTIDDLIRAADKAMYLSKNDGRDRVTIYEESGELP
ncbi:MAG: diguanylate cyclase [Deltaproteobacteria bacterium]|nr:diguanylate cyclase [Deltaproteobacteria bacterium]